MNIAEWLMRTAKRTPNAPALLKGTTVVADYAGFANRVLRLAGALQTRLGINPGDRMALHFANRVEYLELFYAIWAAGGVALPINHKLHPKEVAWIIDNADTKITFVADDSANAIVPLLGSRTAISLDSADYRSLLKNDEMTSLVPRDRDDLAWLFYTSGTTGKPKGVMLTCGNIQAMTLTYFVDVDEVRSTDAMLYAAPISHGAGLYNFMNIIRGSRHVVPESGSFDPAEILSLAAKLDSVTMFAAPTMVRRLVDQAKKTGGDGTGIRSIVYAGGPMYLADIVEAVSVMGPRFMQIYGQGETPMTITAMQRDVVVDRTHPRWRERLSSVGRAHSVIEMKVVDPEGQPVPLGETGEIIARGPTVMMGYWRNPEATAKTLRDGWLWTGDLGSVDEDGFLTLKGRSKDLIILGGSNIYAIEVEEVLLSHPKVSEVAVIGRVDPEWGEVVIAYVVGEADSAELDKLCLDQIARFKRPKEYIKIDSLPKSNYGKVLKKDLRALDAERANNASKVSGN